MGASHGTGAAHGTRSITLHGSPEVKSGSANIDESNGHVTALVFLAELGKQHSRSC